MQPISSAEQEILRVVWASQPVKSSDIIAVLAEKCHWSDSTVKTLIGRLVEKGVLTAKREGRVYLYQALLDQDEWQEMMVRETLSKICQRKHSSILLRLLDDMPMTKQDIQSFQELLLKKENSALEEVPCNCLPGQCHCHKKGVKDEKGTI
ncbi:CopY/TcrY family copper transport repressor [Streptococcus ictaluri]|uniref:Copper transport repressor, CopY/TcrY family n=1 Tax=Streptococcus ictaluri 707-05 TaxID=764299 RepID=G5K478_9STRE|nr:CopY/TcrY family copper transport repressor [Streptococcus ictaluri]EHI69032.1 copper transport repressor, CopY/TcrY family [Streptococcus ictaluri 707-05]